jgi:glyoxylate reductase
VSRVFLTRTIPRAGIEVLEEAGVEVEVGQRDEERSVDRSTLLEGVAAADVLLSLLTESVDREILARNPALLGVVNYAVGYDNVDVEAATELGIPVAHTPSVLTDTTADLTWALLLAVARRLPEADRYVRAGRFRLWGPNLLLGADVSPGGSGERKVLGVVGFGRIGRAVARRAVGFDMDVLVHDPKRDAVEALGPPVRFGDLDRVLEESDFLTLHPRLTPETTHLVGEAELRRMKDTAYLVNTSRGAVVDEAALVRALREGWIAGAALDVYEEEPELAPGLAELDQVVLAPHVGSASRDTRGRMAALAAGSVLRHLEGVPTEDAVNPEVYETEAYRRRVGE